MNANTPFEELSAQDQHLELVSSFKALPIGEISDPDQERFLNKIKTFISQHRHASYLCPALVSEIYLLSLITDKRFAQKIVNHFSYLLFRQDLSGMINRYLYYIQKAPKSCFDTALNDISLLLSHRDTPQDSTPFPSRNFPQILEVFSPQDVIHFIEKEHRRFSKLNAFINTDCINRVISSKDLWDVVVKKDLYPKNAWASHDNLLLCCVLRSKTKRIDTEVEIRKSSQYKILKEIYTAFPLPTLVQKSLDLNPKMLDMLASENEILSNDLVNYFGHQTTNLKMSSLKVSLPFVYASYEKNQIKKAISNSSKSNLPLSSSRKM